MAASAWSEETTSVTLDKAKALDAVKAYVAEAAKSGKKISVWVTAFGGSTKAELSKADARNLTVVVENNSVSISRGKR